MTLNSVVKNKLIKLKLIKAMVCYKEKYAFVMRQKKEGIKLLSK